MVQDNIKDIISKSVNSINYSNIDLKKVIENINECLKQNQDLIISANQIDLKNNNGIKFDFTVTQRIFTDVLNEEQLYDKVITSKKSDDKNIIYGKQISNIGNIVVVFDGNSYILLEMILKNILANNSVIFNCNNFMLGTNQILIQLIQKTLEELKLSKNQFQLFISNSPRILLSNFANIDLIIAIGSHELQRMVLKDSQSKIIVSGYEYFDIYIESKEHIDFIKTILKQTHYINLYINENLNLTSPNAIMVSDVYEAITQINFNGALNSASIFTDNTSNASKFIKGIKSNMITVNTSPTIERKLNIEQKDLTVIKTVIYPVSYKFNSSKTEIEIS